MKRHLLVVCVSALALMIAALAPAVASGYPPPSQATVHPGVMTFTKGAQCTSNFVFTRESNVYLGQAAHCSSVEDQVGTDGCDIESFPIGTRVKVNGASRRGTMVYNSWLTMQAKGETNANACEYNDFALVKIDPADVGRVNPSVPGFGGPTGVGGVGGLGSTVYSYGNSILRGGITQLSPKQGVVVQNTGGGWNHTVYTATPGIPGDSGSGFLNASGRAIGVLSALEVLPVAGSNGVGDLRKELAYMRANSSFSGVRLAQGTEPFDPSLIGAILDT